MNERLESAAVEDVENDLSTVKTAIDDNDDASIDQRSRPEGRSSSHAYKLPVDNSAINPDSNLSGCTNTKLIVEKQSLDPSKGSNCDTHVSHTMHPIVASTVCNHEKNRAANCSTVGYEFMSRDA